MYKIIKTIGADALVRIEDNAFIPFDADNRDYQEYVHWVNAGNTATPYVAPAALIPSSITMRQARLALLDADKLSAVNDAINNLPSPIKERAQIEWDYSNEVQRANGVVSVIGPLIGLSESDIDTLFTNAILL